MRHLGSAAILAASVLGALAAFACTGDDPPAVPTPTGLATQGAAPTQSSPKAIELSGPARQASGTTLFIVTGCTECDGPDVALQAHSSGPTGQVQVTTVMGPDHSALEGMTIGQIDGAADGTILAVVACAAEYCGGLGQGPVRDWRVLYSVNFGADWMTAFETRSNYVYLEDVTPEGMIVGEVSSDGTTSTTTRTVVNAAGQKRVIAPPAEAGKYARVSLSRSGIDLWIEGRSESGTLGDRLFKADGTEIRLTPDTLGQLARVWTTPAGELAALWASPAMLLSVHPAAGGAATEVFDIPGVRLTGVVSSHLLLGNAVAANPNLPVVIDLNAGVGTIITNDVLAAQQGRNTFIAYKVGS